MVSTSNFNGVVDDSAEPNGFAAAADEKEPNNGAVPNPVELTVAEPVPVLVPVAVPVPVAGERAKAGATVPLVNGDFGCFGFETGDLATLPRALEEAPPVKPPVAAIAKVVAVAALAAEAAVAEEEAPAAGRG